LPISPSFPSRASLTQFSSVDFGKDNLRDASPGDNLPLVTSLTASSCVQLTFLSNIHLSV
jgi:hypothetical protein